nr:DUF4158 domain-containing protein [Streptomyces hirsutus]
MALFNHAVTWLRKNRVLLPGVSVLARQVSEARTAAERRLYKAAARAAHRADPALAPALAELLVVPEGRRVSELERLRTPPTKSTGTAMERGEEISAFALGRVHLSRVPVNRLISPARRASDRQRLAMLPQLEKAARILAKASKILTAELDLVAEAEADLAVGGGRGGRAA